MLRAACPSRRCEVASSVKGRCARRHAKQVDQGTDDHLFARWAGNGRIYARRPGRQGASALTARAAGRPLLLCRPTVLPFRVDICTQSQRLRPSVGLTRSTSRRKLVLSPLVPYGTPPNRHAGIRSAHSTTPQGSVSSAPFRTSEPGVGASRCAAFPGPRTALRPRSPETRSRSGTVERRRDGCTH